MAPGLMGVDHGVDERLSIENVGFGVEFYMRLLRRLGQWTVEVSGDGGQVTGS